MTPSLPTFFIASASMRPISGSPLAEIVPTCAISSFVETFFERFSMSLTTALTAMSTPRLRSIGFIPAGIVGWAHRKFGKHEGRDVESLIVEVATGHATLQNAAHGQ